MGPVWTPRQRVLHGVTYSVIHSTNDNFSEELSIILTEGNSLANLTCFQVIDCTYKTVRIALCINTKEGNIFKTYTETYWWSAKTIVFI